MAKKKKHLNAVEFFGEISDEIVEKVLTGELELAKANAKEVRVSDLLGFFCRGSEFKCGKYTCEEDKHCCTQKFHCNIEFIET